MTTKTYIDKFNTIIKGSKLNTGLNPVAELCYGTSTTRILLHFDVERVKRMYEDKIMPDMSKMRHILMIRNAGSIDFTQIHQREISSIDDHMKIRAASFDVIFFLVPMPWDRGKGFDYTETFFNNDFYTEKPREAGRLLSKDGCNWYQCRNGVKWPDEGIYTNQKLSEEYDKFSSDEGSAIVIGRQHFDVGNENVRLDITDIFNKFITGELKNYGIGMAFSPMLEHIGELTGNDAPRYENYVGFLTDKTNTFFEPFVETRYCDHINDDRGNFVLGKDNKLYLYANIGGRPENLDELPTCSIDGQSYEVKQATKGVYYIELNLSPGQYEPETMLFDTWDNLKYKGQTFDPVELDFTLKATSGWFNFSDGNFSTVSFTPSISGISAREKIKRGDIRRLNVLARETYTAKQSQSVTNVEVRLYVKDGEREIDVFPWEFINTTLYGSYVMIDTNVMIPQTYHVDIRFTCDDQTIIHHDQLQFDIVDDLNNKYA